MGFIGSGATTCRYVSPAHQTVIDPYVRLDSWPTPAIDNFAGTNLCNLSGTHLFVFLSKDEVESFNWLL
jgi:hypothetical protein